ncbi:hypothetical protein [Haloferula sp.]|uniref:hypothetical protein n=1 Tax=Haloferula sp. TaxID=2497595 RepID=UPI003C797126
MRPALLTLLCFQVANLHAENIDPDLIFDRPEGARGQAEVQIFAGLESRYVSEGRDNLDGAGLVTGTVEAGWEYLSLGAWYANSPDVDYDELQLNAALTKNWGDFEAYVNYTHLRFPLDGEHDNEVGLGAALGGLPAGFVVAVDSYYSFGSSGSFIELTLANEYEINDCLILAPAVVFGMNEGYISDGHNGANHVTLNLAAEYAFTPSFAVTAHAAYNFALNRDVLLPGDLLLGDFFYAGASLRWTF